MIGSKSMLTKRILMMSKAAFRVSLVAQTVKNLPATQETQVQFLGREDPLEKGMATHSSTGRIPWTEEPGGLQSMESQRAGHNWGTDKAVFKARQPERLPLMVNTWPQDALSKAWVSIVFPSSPPSKCFRPQWIVKRPVYLWFLVCGVYWYKSKLGEGGWVVFLIPVA